MNVSRVILLLISFVAFNTSVSAADVVNSQPQLTELENKRIASEFNKVFKSSDSSGYQKLNRNPWANKRAKQQQQAKRSLKISASLDSCEQYSNKQRGQCYANGHGAAKCERFYSARINYCGEYF